jgi:hypothetical protein
VQCGKPVFNPTDAAAAALAAGRVSASALSIVFLCRHVFHLGCAFPNLAELPPLARPDHVLSSSSLLSLDPTGGVMVAGVAEGGSSNATKVMGSRIRFGAELRASVEATCRVCKDHVLTEH